MATVLEDMDLKSVRNMVRDSLGLEGDVEINPETTLLELGAEDLDLVDLLFKLGVPIGKYVVDYESRKIRDYSEDILSVAEWERDRRNIPQYEHLEELSKSKGINALKAVLNISDCVSIGQYLAEHRQAA